MLRMPSAQVWFAVHRLDAHQAHQARHTLATDLVAIATQNNSDLPRPVKWPFQMQLVDHAHQFKITCFHGRRLPVHGSTRHLQQRALPLDRYALTLGSNLFDPLRSAYFLSTSDKKSRSATSFPIVWCSLAILPSSL